MGDPNIFSGATPAATVKGYSRRAEVTVSAGAITSFTISDTNVTADNIILFSIEQDDANITFDDSPIYISKRTAGTSFTVSVGGTASAEGTIYINYLLVELQPEHIPFQFFAGFEFLWCLGPQSMPHHLHPLIS